MLLREQKKRGRPNRKARARASRLLGMPMPTLSTLGFPAKPKQLDVHQELCRSSETTEKQARSSR